MGKYQFSIALREKTTLFGVNDCKQSLNSLWFNSFLNSHNKLRAYLNLSRPKAIKPVIGSTRAICVRNPLAARNILIKHNWSTPSVKI